MAARFFGGRTPQYFVMAGRSPYGMGFPFGGYPGFYPGGYPSYFAGGYPGYYAGFNLGGYPRPAPAAPVPYLVYRWPAWFSAGYPAQGPGQGGYIPGYQPRALPYAFDPTTVVSPVNVVPPVLPLWYNPNAAVPPAMGTVAAPWVLNPFAAPSANAAEGTEWNQGLDESREWDSH